MVIKLYNTLIRRKELFEPIKPGRVGLYTCGPTVYWYQHIGNLRSYIFADVLKRVLSFNGLKVDHVVNVTDVGHLTSDSDIGDDKVEIAAKREGKSVSQITKFYFDEFVTDLNSLNVLQPSRWVWASQHIADQIALIKKLEKGGYTYQTSDGVYFDTSKFSDYGKLSKKAIGELQGGKRVSLGEKRHKTDFALWKFSGGEKRLQEWPSPWGKGFPGWHIECSAMSTKYLGSHFDIHTGGIDHIPVHHENEIAQSTCGYSSSPWVNVWMHGEFLITPGGKMAKSSGKIVRLSELVSKGFDPLAYRYFLFTAHYRKPLTWSGGAMSSAAKSYSRLRELTSALVDDKKVNEKYLESFCACINNDLDMPGAMAVLWKLLRDKDAVGKYACVRKMDEVFGLDLLKKVSVDVPSDIQKLIDKREDARKSKDWAMSDKLRDELSEKGWVVKDTASGPSLSRV